MRLPIPALLVSAFFLCGAGFCQRANSQTKPPQKNTAATVSGKVTIKGKPAAGVVVGMRMSRPTQFDPTFKATTDQDGNYRIIDLPAASYEVAPVAPALLISDVNNARGQTVVISEGEQIAGIDFELVRGGVITGRVTDADGQPVVEERINLLPADSRDQRGSMYPVPNGFRTDDRGIYRIFGIGPGHYQISAGADYPSRGMGRSPLIFYPDVMDPAKATVVEIGEGTEATRIDITLPGQTAQRFAANGRVLDDAGKPVVNAEIDLARITVSDANSFSSQGGFTAARSGSQGEFLLEKLAPGKYSVSIYPTESNLRAEPVTFDIVDQDVSGLLIKASMGTSLSGVVVIEGVKENSVMPSLSQAYISVNVVNEALHFTSSQSASVKADGSFRIAGLKSGTANFSLYILGRWTATSRTERDGVAQPKGILVQDAEQITGIRVFVAFHNGSIRGVIKLENGTLPPGGRLMIQLIRKAGEPGAAVEPVAADSRGHFLMEGLAAGDYELIVMAYLPGSRQKPPTATQPVTVTEGAATDVMLTIDLTPNPNP